MPNIIYQCGKKTVLKKHSNEKCEWLGMPFCLLSCTFSLAVSMRYISGDFDFANEKLEVLRKIFVKKAIL